MKKFIMTFVFSLFAMVAFAFANNTDVLSASAANDLSVSVTKLTAAEGGYVQAGDYKVTLSIAQNTGFAHLGVRFEYDNVNFVPVLEDDGSLAVQSIMSGFASQVGYSSSLGRVGVSLMSSYNQTDNGTIISFYLTQTGTAANAFPLESVQVFDMMNEDNENVSYNISNQCAVRNVYRVGDANADGNIRIFDASLIRQIVSNANGVTVTENNFMNYTTTTNVGEGVCFALMDADGDGVLTNTDADIVTDYIAGYPVEDPMLDYVTVYFTISVS